MLHGRHVVIIGGSSGVGLATARMLEKEGARITVASRSAEKLKQTRATLGPNAATAELDVSRERDVAAFFSAQTFLHDVVVTATASVPGAILHSDTDRMRAAFEVKFWGQLFAAKHSIPRLQPHGSVILFSGISARRPNVTTTALSAQNGAVEALVRALAVEAAPIRVNAVCPGVIDTPLWNSIDAARRDAVFGNIASRIPARRVGTAVDCASAVLFLLTNTYITGTVLDVEGGALLG